LSGAIFGETVESVVVSKRRTLSKWSFLRKRKGICGGGYKTWKKNQGGAGEEHSPRHPDSAEGGEWGDWHAQPPLNAE